MSAEDYPLGARLLHRLALAWPPAASASFELERLAARAAPASEDRHVFIAGLARAGSTILLHAIHGSGEFRSLTYRDMPFVLMPVMWRRLSRRGARNMARKERAHGDNIEVDYDSPEAFEEVFWRAFCGRDYISDDHLRPHEVSADVGADFRAYVDQVMASREAPGQRRYLSKNNNNVLRLAAIAAAFPRSLIVIPFRHPLAQADSLRSQHRRFVERHNQQKFSRQYMSWLGHYEFGADHRPFRFGTGTARAETDLDTQSLAYWLQIWLETYTFIAAHRPSNSLLVCYEDLCNNPDAHLGRIFEPVGLSLPSPATNVSFKVATRTPTENVNAALTSKALDLYADLRSRQGA